MERARGGQEPTWVGPGSLLAPCQLPPSPVCSPWLPLRHHHHHSAQILNQFEGEGGVDSELFEKQRYCAWRAAEIRKALREGRQPTPPPAGTPAPGAETGPSASGGSVGGSGGGGGLDDLPPASGSSDWAYK
mgnify:CR=1 FL=1